MTFIKYMAIAFLLLPLIVKGQHKAVATSEKTLKQAVQKVYPACVRAYGIDSVSRKQNSAQFSAVVVSKDGILLTVAHAVKPGSLYKISFPSGRETYAKALGRIVTDTKNVLPDVAMMQIIENGTWPFAEMGRSAALNAGDLCFGVSYPESQNITVPMMRLGKIITSLNTWGFTESTCIMETGDSGGPLFDISGRVIALHSRIDKPEGVSYEVPIDMYRKYFTALQSVTNYDSLPLTTDSIPSDGIDPSGMNRLTDAAAISKPVKAGIVKIVTSDGNNQVAYGSVFQLKDGRQIIVSKSSNVADSSMAATGEKRLLIKVIRRDRQHDLVAFTVPYTFPAATAAGSLNAVSIMDNRNIGTLLNTPLPDGDSKKSVGGASLEKLPNRYSSGGFGAYLQEQNGWPAITKVDTTGPARKAGLKEGDCVFAINGISVAGAKDFNSEMMKYYPGDSITFSIKRDTDTLSFPLLLEPRILKEQNHPMNRFEGGKSARRDGFTNVILHDARLRNNECGSLLYDNAGRLLGINIARFSHTTTVALEISVVSAFLSSL